MSYGGLRPLADGKELNKSVGMRSWPIAIVFILATQSASGWAQSKGPERVPLKRQLIGLSPEKASALLFKLQDAQRRLSAGQSQPFELLAGSIASYDETKVSAREAFLQLPFDQVWNFELLRSDTPLRQSYKLEYAPNGLGQLYWEIKVDLRSDGDLQRVVMLWRFPAPF